MNPFKAIELTKIFLYFLEFKTQDKLEYTWFPAGSNGVVFRVKANNDAHLALTSSEAESDPMLEVFLGGWKNTKSVIRKNRTKPDVVEVDTPDIVNGGEYRGFWIRWDRNVINVGKEGEAAPFMTYENSEEFPINFVGVCTGWGAEGDWILEAPVYETPAAAFSIGGAPVWVEASADSIPDDAFVGGQDHGEELYVGRARHEGALIPGKFAKSHGVCYVAWGGGEHGKSEFEVLVGGGNWIAVSGADIPPNAFPAGIINILIMNIFIIFHSL